MVMRRWEGRVRVGSAWVMGMVVILALIVCDFYVTLQIRDIISLAVYEVVVLHRVSFSIYRWR
jgi:hypothetical protein